MKESNTLKAIFLPESIRKILHVKSNEFVDIVVKGGEVFLKNQWMNGVEQINDVIKDEFAKVGVVDDKTAADFVENFRHG